MVKQCCRKGNLHILLCSNSFGQLLYTLGTSRRPILSNDECWNCCSDTSSCSMVKYELKCKWKGKYRKKVMVAFPGSFSPYIIPILWAGAVAPACPFENNGKKLAWAAGWPWRRLWKTYIYKTMHPIYSLRRVVDLFHIITWLLCKLGMWYFWLLTGDLLIRSTRLTYIFDAMTTGNSKLFVH